MRHSLPFVLGSSGSAADDDGGAEIGLNDGHGEADHHHHLWQVALQQEVHPLPCLLAEGANVQLPLDVLGSHTD